jgi:hypothetical protein
MNLAQLFRSESKKYVAFYLADNRVDVASDATPFSAGEAYCRLWLVEMYLAKGVDWFKTRYPIVHAATRFTHGGKTVTIPHLAGPDYLKQFAKGNLDKIIQHNFQLTSLFPFNHGVVEFEAGLFSMVASDPIGRFITAMERLSKVIPVPELSSVVNVAGPVYSGIEDLLGIGNNEFELGYQQTFAPDGGGGSNLLRPGYFAAILAEEDKIDKETLCVVNDSLRTGAKGETKAFLKNHQPFKGYSYMLFRVEKRPNQDYESLTNIKELVIKAQDAIFNGDNDKAKQILTAIRIAIYRSPDIAKKDRRQMVLKIEAELQELGLEAAAQEVEKRSLYAIMQREVPAIDAAKATELTALEQMFGE